MATNTRKVSKNTRVSDLITVEDIQKWEPDVPVIIDAGTGVGKSYFIKNTLYDIAKEEGQKILFLIHRRKCVDQFIMEIEADGKDDVIDIVTYQKFSMHKSRYNDFGEEDFLIHTTTVTLYQTNTTTSQKMQVSMTQQTWLMR